MAQSMTRLVLQRARAMIAEPDQWLQGDWKQPLDRGGFKRCAYQAICDAARELGLPISGPLSAVMKAMGAGRRAAIKRLPEFNDRFSHGEVLALIDLALEGA